MGCSNSNTKEITQHNLNNKHIPKKLYSSKSVLICIFCGGEKCMHENYLENPTHNAIVGLNSDQIDENLFASQRPSNILIEQFNLIEQFKNKNIGLIVNLQQPGEHPFCGPNKGLDEESGFSYSPSKFEIHSIKVKLFALIDLNVPDSLNSMLNIVKLMYYYINDLKQKVFVHCHAGLGRTGITIVCYKIFSEGVYYEKAIIEIRKIRKKCVQNRKQVQFCKRFYYYILNLREIFTYEKCNIDLFIENQNELNVGKYKFNHFKYNYFVPLILQYLFDCILNIKERFIESVIDFYKDFNKVFSGKIRENNKDFDIYINNINIGNFNILQKTNDIILIIELAYYWLKNCVKYCISIESISNLSDDFTNYKNCFNEYELENIVFCINFLKNFECQNKEEENEKNLMIKNLFISLIEEDNNNNNINDKFIDFIKYLSVNIEDNSIHFQNINELNESENLIFTNNRNINSRKESINNNKIKRNNYEDSLIFQINHSKKPWIIEEDC